MEGDHQEPVPVIHIVDDDPSFLRALSRLLRASGYHVEPFASGEELLQHQCKLQDAPGCIIIDLELPGLNGLDLQEKISQLRDPLPVIFLTGHGNVPSSVLAMKRKAVDFLTKPVCVDDLIAAINQAIKTDVEARLKRNQRRELLARYNGLTPREREVLALVVRGMLNKQIAYELGTVERTIKAHRAQVMAKMRVHSIAELVRAAEQLGDMEIQKKTY